MEHNATAADVLEARSVGRNSSVVVGRDALGNVFVTGDGNNVQVKLTVIVADARLRASDPSSLQNPYRGLDAFRETDCALFFGREDLITRLWTRVHGLQRGDAPRLLPILGASGSGKSSLLRAGLLPELVRQPMEGMRSPTVLVLRPGTNPLQRLADVLPTVRDEDRRVALDRKALPTDSVDMVHRAVQSFGDADQRVVLLVDQLEELFTECDSAAARSAFLATLAHAAAQPDHLVSVIFAMRNDFAGSLRANDAFAAAVREQRFTVSQMSREQLVDAIEKPAKVLGHPWPSGLVENLVLQCEGRSGALPLLQFALKRLWPEHLAGGMAESWSSRLIEDFVVQVADTLFESTGEVRHRDANQRIIRRAFIAMVRLGEGTTDMRRTARLSEIVGRRESHAQVRAVLAPFVAPEARLVTTSEIDGEPTYELAHEALVGSWDRLREWLGHFARKVDAAAIRDEVRLRRRLWHAMQAWRFDREALWRPPDLGLAKELRDRDPEELSELEHKFIAASLAAWESHRRGRRRVRMGVSALSIVFCIVVSILALVAWRQANEADRRIAESARVYQEMGRLLLVEAERPLEALPFLVEARASTETIGGTPSATLRMLFAQATRNLPVSPPLQHQGSVESAAFSTDGRRVVTASDDKTARVWDATSGQPLSPPILHQARVVSAMFSPDDTRVVTASWDNTARVWDASSGQPLSPPLQHHDLVVSAAFSPDGKLVVTASDDKTARVWDASSGQPLSPPLHHEDLVVSAAFSPDGTRVVTASADDTARVWDVSSGYPLSPPLRHQRAVVSAAFSPDGKRVVTASSDHTARVWDGSSGTSLSLRLEHQDFVVSAAFSPDGTRVVTASADKTARVWDAATGKPLSAPLEHQGPVVSAAFSPDGRHVVTASDDRTARVWDAASGEPLSPPLRHRARVMCAAFSPDGTRVVTASADNTARVWAAATGKQLLLLPQHQDRVVSAEFRADGLRVVTAGDDKTARVWNDSGKPLSPPLQDSVERAVLSTDGKLVVTISADHAARVWDVSSGTPSTFPLRHKERVVTAAFSTDGTRVVTASDDHTAQVWDTASGKSVTAPLRHQDWVVIAGFSPDGTRVVTASDDGTAHIWGATYGRSLASLPHHGPVATAVFNHSGTRVVTASTDGTAQVWDGYSGKPASPPLSHQDRVVSAVFSRDGTLVVTASADKTARVWDSHSGKPLTPPLEHQGPVVSAVFSPDGTRVVTASDDKTAQVWDAASGRPLTRLLQHPDRVMRAAFNSDGTRVITTSADDTVRIWELPQAAGTLNDWRAIVDRVSPIKSRTDIPTL